LNSGCTPVLIAPNEAADEATSYLPGYRYELWAKAIANVYGFINNTVALGTYANAVAASMMADGVHPNSAGNAVIAQGVCKYIGLPFLSGEFTQEAYPTSGTLEYEYTGDLTDVHTTIARGDTEDIYTLGLINGYPCVTFALEVTANRYGTGAVTRSIHYITVTNATTLQQANSVNVISSVEIFRDTAGDTYEHNHTITAAIVSNQAVITLESNAGDNAAVTSQVYHIKGSYVASFLSVQGQSVYEF